MFTLAACVPVSPQLYLLQPNNSFISVSRLKLAADFVLLPEVSFKQSGITGSATAVQGRQSVQAGIQCNAVSKIKVARLNAAASLLQPSSFFDSHNAHSLYSVSKVQVSPGANHKIRSSTCAGASRLSIVSTNSLLAVLRKRLGHAGNIIVAIKEKGSAPGTNGIWLSISSPSIKSVSFQSQSLQLMLSVKGFRLLQILSSSQRGRNNICSTRRRPSQSINFLLRSIASQAMSGVVYRCGLYATIEAGPCSPMPKE